MIDALCAWLNGNRDYTEGAVLYSVYGKDPLLKTLFLTGVTPYTRSKLFEELKNLYYRVTSQEDDTNDTAAPDKPKSHFPVNDPLINACDTKAKNLYKEMMNKRAVLFNLCKSEDWEDENSPDKVTARGKLSFEILEMNYTVDKAYEDLAYVREHGRLPDQPAPVQEKYALLPDAMVKHEMDNLRKNLNKIKKKEVTPARSVAIKEHEENLKKLEQRWALLTFHPKH
jgi:predicted DNA binding protein